MPNETPEQYVIQLQHLKVGDRYLPQYLAKPPKAITQRPSEALAFESAKAADTHAHYTLPANRTYHVTPLRDAPTSKDPRLVG